jgi:hypothetical protein
MGLLNRLLGPPEPSPRAEHRRRHPPESWTPPVTRADADRVDAQTNASEPAAWLGAVATFGAVGVAALLSAPFRASTYRKARPVTPVRHPTRW